MKVLVMLVLAGFGSTMMAGESDCDPWEKKRGVKCIFNKRPTTKWVRTCYDPHLLDWEESICTDLDPNKMTTACTDWELYKGSSCVHHDGGFAKVWVRSCIKPSGYAEKTCSYQTP